MCELLGMSANVPTDICFSFAGLMQRGGGTGPHSDGWGIAFYEGRGARCFHDVNPSVKSPIADLIKEYPIKSQVVVSHIRQANVGDVCLENTHPFQRELWGYTWTFAHNGQLDKALFEKPLSFYQPVGSTDSEYAFCWMLGKIRQHFPQRPDDPTQLSALILELSQELRELGIFNMLLTESEQLFAFCSTKLSWLTRRAPFGVAHLTDYQLKVDFVEHTNPNDIVTVVATVPLTEDEPWQALQPGQLMALINGEPQS